MKINFHFIELPLAVTVATGPVETGPLGLNEKYVELLNRRHDTHMKKALLTSLNRIYYC